MQRLSLRPLRAVFAAAVALSVASAAAPAEAQRFCPPGYVRGRFGRCRPAPVVAACPPGYLRNGAVCVPVVVRPSPRVCPRGYRFFRGRCILR